ncbi:hypothetical protein ACS0TY_004705 [Phlomoides rotata]
MKDVLILVLCEGVLCGDGQPGSSELVAGTSGEVSPSLHARSSIHVVCCLNLLNLFFLIEICT